MVGLRLALAAALLRRQPQDCCARNAQCPGGLDCSQRPYVCFVGARYAGQSLGSNRVYWRNPVLEEKLAAACDETARPADCHAQVDAKQLPYFTYPRAWYQQVRAIAATTPKKTRFCFMGSSSPCRSWVPAFASEFFGYGDFLGFTDKGAAYSAIGAFNHTEGFDGHRPQDYRSNGKMTDAEKQQIRDQKNRFDADYFRGLAECEYALAPRGMEPYSMRFYEAIAAGSIPVLFTSADQRRSPEEETLVRVKAYRYVEIPRGAPNIDGALLSSLEYAAAAEANRKLFEAHHLLDATPFGGLKA